MTHLKQNDLAAMLSRMMTARPISADVSEEDAAFIRDNATRIEGETAGRMLDYDGDPSPSED